MQPEFQVPLPGLLAICHQAVRDEVFARLSEAGYGELRPTHSCVFGTIGPGGDRLTALAERANMTKQAVGEAVSELEASGYVERVPDPSDGRAKIIQFTDRGQESYALGMEIVDDIQRRWAEQYGAERVDGMLELLQQVAGDVQSAPAAIRPAA
jgi:DNA-binding MarR family transcriptional regulator